MPRPYTFPSQVGPKWVKKMMPWIELFWHEKKRHPTDSELVQKFGFTPTQLLQLRESKFYKNTLALYGISWDRDDLSAEQVAAITMITNFSDTRSTEAKLAAINVTPEQLNGWYSNPVFQRELANRADATLDNIFPEAQAQLARQIKKGNFPALKFYYEITGRAQSPETVNVKLAMMRLIEIVQKHVQDPEILSAIATDMRSITNPGPEAPVALKELYVGYVNNEL